MDPQQLIRSQIGSSAISSILKYQEKKSKKHIPITKGCNIIWLACGNQVYMFIEISRSSVATHTIFFLEYGGENFKY